MSYNWNVYKLFKNGKRAKAPFHIFEYEDPETVREYFNEKVRENFTEKLREAKLLILRSDLPQGRREEENKEIEKNLQKRKNRVFAKHLKTIDFTTFKHSHIVGGLIFCSQSEWQWQWAAMEAATQRYLVGLSPTFSTAHAAEAWMTEEINNL